MLLQNTDMFVNVGNHEFKNNNCNFHNIWKILFELQIPVEVYTSVMDISLCIMCNSSSTLEDFHVNFVPGDGTLWISFIISGHS